MAQGVKTLAVVGTTLVGLVLIGCADGAAPTPLPDTSTAVPTAEVAPVTPAPATPVPPTQTPQDPSPTPAAPTAEVTADIVNFTHQDLVVTVGTEVTWVNQDEALHTTTSGSQGDPSGIWNSSTLAQGGTFAFTFNQIGTFIYFCRVHPSTMNGTVTVLPPGEARAAPSPTAAPAPQATATVAPAPQPTATAAPAPSPTPIATAVTAQEPTPVPTAATAPPPGAGTTAGVSESVTIEIVRASEPIDVDIVDFRLRNLTVHVGTTVTWTNLDPVPHTTTAGTPGSQSGEWDSPFLSENQEYSFKFTQAGTFPYYCRIHPSMTGRVTVEGSSHSNPGSSSADTQTPTPTPTATPASTSSSSGGY